MKSRFRSGRGIGATPDTVRDAASGRRSSATAARYPAQYQARAGFRHRAPQRTRHRPELRPAEPFSAPAAACRSVIRPGYSARTRPRPAGSTRGPPPRISDPARVRTSRKARFAANIRTTSAYSRTPHGAGHRNKPRNRGCTPVPHTRFRHERPPVRLFSQKTGPNPPPPPRTDCGRVRTVLHARSLRRTHGTAPPAAAAANRQSPARIRETNSSNTPYLL